MQITYQSDCELLDEEWVDLISLAKNMGVPKEEILSYFRSATIQDAPLSPIT